MRSERTDANCIYSFEGHVVINFVKSLFSYRCISRITTLPCPTSNKKVKLYDETPFQQPSLQCTQIIWPEAELNKFILLNLIHSFNHLFIYLFICAFIHLFVRSFARPIDRSFDSFRSFFFTTFMSFFQIFLKKIQFKARLEFNCRFSVLSREN